MILYPNCKINIGLRVIRKREDGYHDLETIFYPVLGLFDDRAVELSTVFKVNSHFLSFASSISFLT